MLKVITFVYKVKNPPPQSALALNFVGQLQRQVLVQIAHYHIWKYFSQSHFWHILSCYPLGLLDCDFFLFSIETGFENITCFFTTFTLTLYYTNILQTTNYWTTTFAFTEFSTTEYVTTKSPTTKGKIIVFIKRRVLITSACVYYNTRENVWASWMDSFCCVLNINKYFD